MTYQELRSKWNARRELLSILEANVSAEKTIAEFISDLDEFHNAAHTTTLSLKEAAELTGYSTRHLGRLIQQGKIPNLGRRNAPRVRLSDLCFKTPGLRKSEHGNKFETVRSRIAKSVITDSKGLHDDTDQTI